jgi:hypothetical protein
MSNPIVEAAKKRKLAQDELMAKVAAEAAQNALVNGSISSGMASSADLGNMVNTTPPVEPEPEKVVEAPQGSYVAQNLKRFFKANGTKVEATDGFFIPQDEEEDAILKHFASNVWGMVELVPYVTAK